MLTPKQILTKARALIKKGWTQGPFAVDKDGDDVNEHSKAACKWCSVGALNAAVKNSVNIPKSYTAARLEAEGLLEKAITKLGYESYSAINFNEADGRTQKQVLRAFDKAIELASVKPKKS